MSIYDRALSPQRFLRQGSTGLLGIGQPAQLPGRPPIPSTDVGNVDYEGAITEQNNLESQQQQQLYNSLLNIVQLGAVGASGGFGTQQYATQPGQSPLFGSVVGGGSSTAPYA